MTLVGSFGMQICHFQPGVKGPIPWTGPADFEEIDLEQCFECNPHRCIILSNSAAKWQGMYAEMQKER